jgi:hypothetical protein
MTLCEIERAQPCIGRREAAPPVRRLLDATLPAPVTIAMRGGNMATKKRTVRNRGRKRGALRASIASRLERELPRRVGAYVNEVQRLLDRLEREIQRASRRTRAEATRLLRQARSQLGIVERGQSNWASLVARYREEAARVLRTLEGAIAPSGGAMRSARARLAHTSRKLPKRRPTSRARKTSRKPAGKTARRGR